MNNKIFRIQSLGGIVELQPQPDGSASRIENWTKDETTGGWSTRLGYERYNPVASNSFAPFQALKRIDSVFIHSRRNRAMEVVLLSSEGNLYYINDVTGTMTLSTLQSGRNVPANSELPTQYIPFGKFTIIVNGQDAPLKFDGWPLDRSSFANSPLFTSLGFNNRPPAPTPWDVEVNQAATPNGESVSIFFTRNSGKGLGFPVDDAATDKDNKFYYKISFVSDTGSESPLSLASDVVQFTTTNGGGPAYVLANQRYAIALEIPTGGDNIIARNIYRTKNTSSDAGNDRTFYYLDTIRNNVDTLYYDSTGSGALGSTAPSEETSVEFPARRANLGADFQGCLFLNGGDTDSHNLYFSNPLKPDQFSGLDFITVGNSAGGGITGLHSYYNTLLVFRETAIDVVTGSYPNFQLTQVSNSVGTTATNTITTVPELGVLFLSKDGVYLFSGGGAGVYGGAVAQLTKISTPIHRQMKQLNEAVLARATAAYSTKTREWQCFFAKEGAEKPNFGVVYHVDKQSWSYRSNFPVGCMTTDRGGNLIFGHNLGATAANAPAGLFVMSKRRVQGQTDSGDTVVDNSPFTSIYFSKWHEFGDQTRKKKIHYVVLHCLTTGDVSMPLKHYIDFAYTGTSATTMKQQRPDHTDQNVYGKAVLGTDTWEDQFLTQIRYAVAVNACSTFAFEIETTNDTTIIGYDIHYTEIQTKIVAGKPV
jgi:hypothetical protein